MTPEDKNLGRQSAESRLSRLGGAITPPQKYLSQTNRLDGAINNGPKKYDLGNFALKEDPAPAKTNNAPEKSESAHGVKMDMFLATAESRALSREAERVSKDQGAKKSSVVESAPKVESEKPEPKPEPKKKFEEAPLTDLGFIEVDYAEAIDLESERFRRPFIIDFISLRKEETRRRIEEKMRAEEELASEVAKKPIDVSKEDISEAKKESTEIHTAIVSTHGGEAEKVEKIETKSERRSLGAIKYVIGAAIVVLGIGGVAAFANKGSSDSASDLNKALIGLVTPNDTRSFSGTARVIEGEEEKVSQFDLHLEQGFGEVHVKRDGDVDFNIVDANDGNVNVRFNSVDTMLAKNREANILDAGNGGKYLNEFAEKNRASLTNRWTKLSSKEYEHVLSLMDEKYGAEANCMRFLNYGLRDSVAHMLQGAEIPANNMQKNGSTYKVYASAEEWQGWLDRVNSNEIEALTQCWGDYSVKITLDMESADKAKKVSFEFANETRQIVIEAGENKDYQSLFKNDSHSYDELLTDLRKNLNDVSQPIVLENARRKTGCDSACIKGFSDLTRRRAESMNEEYFAKLFGLKTNEETSQTE